MKQRLVGVATGKSRDLQLVREGGAGDGIRTRDILLGKQILCQLSYSRPRGDILSRGRGSLNGRKLPRSVSGRRSTRAAERGGRASVGPGRRRQGNSSISAWKSRWLTTSSRVGASAVTVAVRGPRSISAISPKKSPGPSWLTRVPSRPTPTCPEMMTMRSSPLSPWRITTLPVGRRLRRSALCPFSPSGHAVGEDREQASDLPRRSGRGRPPGPSSAARAHHTGSPPPRSSASGTGSSSTGRRSGPPPSPTTARAPRRRCRAPRPGRGPASPARARRPAPHERIPTASTAKNTLDDRRSGDPAGRPEHRGQVRSRSGLTSVTSRAIDSSS